MSYTDAKSDLIQTHSRRHLSQKRRLVSVGSLQVLDYTQFSMMRLRLPCMRHIITHHLESAIKNLLQNHSKSECKLLESCWQPNYGLKALNGHKSTPLLNNTATNSPSVTIPNYSWVAALQSLCHNSRNKSAASRTAKYMMQYTEVYSKFTKIVVQASSSTSSFQVRVNLVSLQFGKYNIS